jgi:hypothetical protein
MPRDTREELQALQHELFGRDTTPMPRAFLATARRLTAKAAHRVGVEHRHTDRDVFWIDGRTLGVLSCLGEAERNDAPADEDAEISGRLLQLHKVTNVHLRVKTTYSTSEGKSTWGRKLCRFRSNSEQFLPVEK